MEALNNKIKEKVQEIEKKRAAFNNLSFKGYLKSCLVLILLFCISWVIFKYRSNNQKGDCYYNLLEDIIEIEEKGLILDEQELALANTSKGNYYVEYSANILGDKMFYHVRLKDGKELKIPCCKTWFLMYDKHGKMGEIEVDYPEIMTFVKRPNVIFGKKRKIYVMVLPEGTVPIKRKMISLTLPKISNENNH